MLPGPGKGDAEYMEAEKMTALPVCKLCGNPAYVNGPNFFQCEAPHCGLRGVRMTEAQWLLLMSPAPSRRMVRMESTDGRSFYAGGGFVLVGGNNDGKSVTRINDEFLVPGTPASVAAKLGFEVEG